MFINPTYPLEITNTVRCDRFPMGSQWKRVEGCGS